MNQKVTTTKDPRDIVLNRGNFRNKTMTFQEFVVCCLLKHHMMKELQFTQINFPVVMGVFHGGLMEALVGKGIGETKKEHFKALPKRFHLLFLIDFYAACFFVGRFLFLFYDS